MGSTLLPVILSGGTGSRLWPLSREQHPKQLLPLVGEDTLLQATVRRLENFGDELAHEVLVVTNETYRFIIAEQLRVLGQAGRIILEPAGRNTAPALTLAAFAAQEKNQDPVMLIMPADHVILDLSAFQAAVASGLAHAEKGAFVTFGIVPIRPETGYGYIQKGEGLPHNAAVLERFVEKPNAETATKYVASGQYLWNSGIFMIKASRWLAAVDRFAPGIYQACLTAFSNTYLDGDFLRVDKDNFLLCPSDSIDYAVMENLPSAPELGQGVVIPLNAGWSDIGAWDVLWEVNQKDINGNVSQGEVILEGSSNSMVVSTSRLVTGIGLEDMIVVETPDAIMVADKRRTQGVKKIVEHLRQQQKPQALAHRKLYRPWGYLDTLDTGERFQVARVVIQPGASISLQRHHHRAEHWIVVSGTAEVTRGEEVFFLTENQSTYIPVGQHHRLRNPGKIPLEIIEVRTGTYISEDDIIRLEDAYGRV